MGLIVIKSSQINNLVRFLYIFRDEQNQNKWNEISRLLYFKSDKKYYRSSQKCR
jgi:hypothetical protein